MFIKWREENKPLSAQEEQTLDHMRPAWATPATKKPTHRLYAYLAVSERVEGKPRQRILSYLGSIPAAAAKKGAGEEWKLFWFQVYCHLALLHAERTSYRRVINEVGKRVHDPREEELLQLVGEQWRSYPRWKRNYQAYSSALSWADEAWMCG